MVVDRLVTTGEIPPPGFGHRYHTTDPRATRLLQIAHELELDHEHAQLIRAIEHALARHPALADTPLPVNVDGAIAAIAGDVGLPPEVADALAHHLARPGTRRARARGAGARSPRCARSIPRRTPTTGRPSGAFQNVVNEEARPWSLTKDRRGCVEGLPWRVRCRALPDQTVSTHCERRPFPFLELVGRRRVVRRRRRTAEAVVCCGHGAETGADRDQSRDESDVATSRTRLSEPNEQSDSHDKRHRVMTTSGRIHCERLVGASGLEPLTPAV